MKDKPYSQKKYLGIDMGIKEKLRRLQR